MYNGNELKVGKRFLMNGEPFQVVAYAQKVMGRGGSIINIKAKNLKSGGTISKTISDTDRFEPADIVTKSYDYLYHSGDEYFFMDIDTYEQVSLDKNVIGDNLLFLTDGDKVSLQIFNDEPINLSLEPNVVLEVMDTPPGEKGDTATGGRKPATLSTGLVIQVPLFVNIGDKIKVDTRTKDYMSRS